MVESLCRHGHVRRIPHPRKPSSRSQIAFLASTHGVVTGQKIGYDGLRYEITY